MEMSDRKVRIGAASDRVQKKKKRAAARLYAFSFHLLSWLIQTSGLSTTNYGLYKPL
jgi:hypothetical protein